MLNDQIHLFYQTYGNWEKDAICHAWSQDGIPVSYTHLEDTDRYQPTARFMSLDNAQATPIATTDGGMLGFHASRRDVWGFSCLLYTSRCV